MASGAAQMSGLPSTGYQSKSPATKTSGRSRKTRVQPLLDRDDPPELERIVGHRFPVALGVNDFRLLSDFGIETLIGLIPSESPLRLELEFYATRDLAAGKPKKIVRGGS